MTAYFKWNSITWGKFSIGLSPFPHNSNCLVSSLHSSICCLLEIIFEIIFVESDREVT